jgi:hypothetical protein
MKIHRRDLGRKHAAKCCGDCRAHQGIANPPMPGPRLTEE